MTQTPRIVYRANEDATREVEISALASVYAFVLSCKEKAGGSDAGENDARKVKDACTAEEKYTGT